MRFNLKHSFLDIFCSVSFLLASLLSSPYTLFAIELSKETTPLTTSNSHEKTWKIAYIESGEHDYFRTTLAHIGFSLQDAGLMAGENLPQQLLDDTDSTDASLIWNWLVNNSKGKQIQFLPDAFHSGKWNNDEQKSIIKRIAKRIAEEQDIDLVLAFGTAAGLEAVRANLPVPVFVIASTDPVNAGISVTVKDSGRDNVHVQVDTWHYAQQVLVFHEIFNFKKLGIAYHDTPEGRSIIALPYIEEACKTLGVELVRCTPPLENASHHQNLLQCMEKFSHEVDAVYMTLNLATQQQFIPELVQPLIQMNIPTFAQGGIKETRRGILMSFAQTDFVQSGLHAVRALQKVIAGTLPRHIEQEVSASLNLAINLKTAQDMYWDIPFEVLLASDILFNKDGGIK